MFKHIQGRILGGLWRPRPPGVTKGAPKKGKGKREKKGKRGKKERKEWDKKGQKGKDR